MKSKKAIVGKAGKGDELGRDRGRRSGADVMASIYKEDTVLRIRQPVYSQQEADRQAKAILRKRSEIFVKGRGESVGIPEIRAGTNIELLGLGKVFSKTYYIEKATHTINASGYKTLFNVKDTTI
jgi:phage protein D